MSEIPDDIEYTLAKKLLSDPVEAHRMAREFDHPSAMVLRLSEYHSLRKDLVLPALKYAGENASNFPQWILAFCYGLSDKRLLEFCGFPFILEEISDFFLYSKATDGRHTKEVASEIYQFDLLPLASAMTGEQVWAQIDNQWRAEVGVFYTLKSALINSEPGQLFRALFPQEFSQRFSDGEVELAENYADIPIPDEELKRFYTYAKEWTLDGIVDNALRPRDKEINEEVFNGYLDSIRNFDEIRLNYIFPNKYRNKSGASRPGLYYFALTGGLVCQTIKIYTENS